MPVNSTSIENLWERKMASKTTIWQELNDREMVLMLKVYDKISRQGSWRVNNTIVHMMATITPLSKGTVFKQKWCYTWLFSMIILKLIVKKQTFVKWLKYLSYKHSQWKCTKDVYQRWYLKYKVCMKIQTSNNHNK